MSQATQDYFSAAQGFDFAKTIENAISGTFDAMNACYECCDRHALPGRIALFQEN